MEFPGKINQTSSSESPGSNLSNKQNGFSFSSIKDIDIIPKNNTISQQEQKLPEMDNSPTHSNRNIPEIFLSMSFEKIISNQNEQPKVKKKKRKRRIKKKENVVNGNQFKPVIKTHKKIHRKNKFPKDTVKPVPDVKQYKRRILKPKNLQQEQDEIIDRIALKQELDYQKRIEQAQQLKLQRINEMKTKRIQHDHKISARKKKIENIQNQKMKITMQKFDQAEERRQQIKDQQMEELRKKAELRERRRQRAMEYRMKLVLQKEKKVFKNMQHEIIPTQGRTTPTIIVPRILK